MPTAKDNRSTLFDPEGQGAFVDVVATLGMDEGNNDGEHDGGEVRHAVETPFLI